MSSTNKNKDYLGNINLNLSETEAILCALPLINQVTADSPAQDMRNSIALASASKKLLSMIENSSSPAQKPLKPDHLTAEDIRIMFCAIGFALDILSGQDSGYMFQIDDEWRADLLKHLFVLNKLYPTFENFVDRIESAK